MSLQKIIPVSRSVLHYNRPLVKVGSHGYWLQPLAHGHLMNVRKKQTTVLKKEKEKFRKYVITRYVQYVKSYTNVFAEKFPTAMKMYKVFSVGMKEFLSDLKTYISLRVRIAKDKGFSNLSHEEIKLYQKMPSDMWRIAPVLILSAIPFGNYIIFPLALMKPRTLLCSHFWSIQQKSEFSTLELKERLRHNKPVFRALQSKLDSIPEGKLKETWSGVIASLSSGLHPQPNNIILCKDLFTKEPYHLEHLSFAHLGHLLKMHGMNKGIFRWKKLKHRAFILLEMDRAIIREGGLKSLSTDGLHNACLIRGLNSQHLSSWDMKVWLQKWLDVSVCVDKSSYSLILHLPILISYNHPQNWKLIY